MSSVGELEVGSVDVGGGGIGSQAVHVGRNVPSLAAIAAEHSGPTAVSASYLGFCTN